MNVEGIVEKNSREKENSNLFLPLKFLMSKVPKLQESTIFYFKLYNPKSKHYLVNSTI